MAWDQNLLQKLADDVLGMLRREHAEDARSAGHLSMENWEWPTGVALYGIWKTYEHTRKPETLAYLADWYGRWLSKPAPHRNVNTVAPMLALTCMYAHADPRPDYLPHIQRWADWVAQEMPRTEFGGLQHITVWNKHYQQLWADTLFMTVLFLAKAGLTLGQRAWVEEAKYQFLLHAKYLQDRVSGLWNHGWTFDCRHGFAGAHWARGNGWFTAAAVELLSLLENADDAAARMIRAALEDQVSALWKLQRESGLFTTLIDVEETYEETSASAAIAFGVLKGVRIGVLGEGYRSMGEQAARAVLARIAPDGTVTGVSGGTGMGHDLDHYKRIPQCPTAYGQGLTFLMLTELMAAGDKGAGSALG
ncbi:MAG: glycoside hydrolase family 88 protein [Oscillospiraceae bacterium]|jgi:unsaturated rhamnogalacturonyl hydrolase|nr:glycoside hydrolase family 88 protein [Oscillospiraceae bacterium]